MNDEGHEPKLVPGRMGRRMFSMAALRERIVDAFAEENDAARLREADTTSKRYKLILDTADYVIAVELIQISSDDKADLLRSVYSLLFGYGALDELFADERVTTIALNGIDHAAVRYGHGELVSLPPLFEDEDHLRLVINRLISEAGAELKSDDPVVETGLTIGGRPISLSVVQPSIAFGFNVDIRLHPRSAPTLDDLVAQGFMTEPAVMLLRSLLASPYGFVIAGETETGKTTLLNAIAQEIGGTIAAVERASELRLPPDATGFSVRWATGDSPGASFADQINAALARQPACLLIDEVRSDQPEAIAPLLSVEIPPRQVWVVRAAPHHKRLQSALGMLARRADLAQGEALVHALYERLPFMVTVARIQERLQLFSIAEWQSRVDTDYPDYVMLLRYENGRAQPTGTAPARWLD